jgi:hypothetical protein
MVPERAIGGNRPETPPPRTNITFAFGALSHGFVGKRRNGSTAAFQTARIVLRG